MREVRPALVVVLCVACGSGPVARPPVGGTAVPPEPKRIEPSDRECPVRLINHHRPERGPRKHLGVDFRMCASNHVIAIADGVVMSATPEVPNYADPEYNGGKVVIRHEVNGRWIFWRYTHVQSIRVYPGQEVSRGEVVADFWDAEDGGWIRHVHLSLFGQSLSVEEEDPLRFVVACRSQARPNELVFPVEC